MPIERLETEESIVRPRLKAVPPIQTEPEAPKPTDPSRLEMMTRVIIQVLSVRALLLLAIVGAFILAVKSMTDQSYMSLGVLGVYCAFAIVPIAYLEIRSKST